MTYNWPIILGRSATLAAAFIFCAAAPPAMAGSLYLNGVKIDGATNQHFVGCDVRIDASGNVHITSKSISKNGAPPTDAGKPQKRYFIVTKKDTPGMSQYDIDVFVNAKWVRRLRGADKQVVFEVTKFLQRGDNTVRLLAQKDLTDGRRSTSARHYFRVILGQGDSGGRNVMLTRKFVDYKRTAMETKNFNDEFTVSVD